MVRTLALALIGVATLNSHTYVSPVVVTSNVDGFVGFCDNSGEEWYYYFENGTDLKEDDSAVLVMDNMGTDTIYDDRIKLVLDKQSSAWYNQYIDKKERGR